MYPRILVPVDGSEASRCGLAEAIRLAAPERSTLVLLHVVDLPPASPHGTDGVGREQLMALLARRARETLDSAVDQAAAHIALRYVEGGRVADRYPANPNGSPDGIAGVTSRDGRATILMPHPERTLRSANFSWAPREWPEDSPWLRMFRNARAWLA